MTCSRHSSVSCGKRVTSRSVASNSERKARDCSLGNMRTSEKLVHGQSNRRGLNQVTITYTNYVPPTVRLTSPNGGEDWMKDGNYSITWEADGNLGSSPITLYWSPDNGNNWNILSANFADEGVYNWTVPNQETGEALIMVVVTDSYGVTATDTSDSTFAIDPPPVAVGGTPSTR